MGPSAQIVATTRWWITIGVRILSIVCLLWSINAVIAATMSYVSQQNLYKNLYSGAMFGGSGAAGAFNSSEWLYSSAIDILLRLLVCVLLWSFAPLIASRLARVPRPLCPGCGYTVTPQLSTCPECGLRLMSAADSTPAATTTGT